MTVVVTVKSVFYNIGDVLEVSKALTRSDTRRVQAVIKGQNTALKNICKSRIKEINLDEHPELLL